MTLVGNWRRSPQAKYQMIAVKHTYPPCPGKCSFMSNHKQGSKIIKRGALDAHNQMSLPLVMKPGFVDRVRFDFVLPRPATIYWA